MLVISIRSTCGTTGAEVCKTSDISIGIWGYYNSYLYIVELPLGCNVREDDNPLLI